MGKHVRSDDPDKARVVAALKESVGGTRVTSVTRELDGSFQGDVLAPTGTGGFRSLGRFAVTLDDSPEPSAGPVGAAEESVKTTRQDTDPLTPDDRFPWVGIDGHAKTVIVLSKSGGAVRYVSMETTGIVVRTAPAETRWKNVDGERVVVRAGIDQLYGRLSDEVGSPWDPRRAARTMAHSSRYFGISAEAKAELEKLTPFTEEEQVTIERKRAERNARFAALSDRKGARMGDDKEPKAPRETASAMFQQLIMEGELKDSEIFAAVQEKFGLDESKRSYVGWYRNHLRKKGKNPPEKIEEEPAAEEEEAPAVAAPPKPAPRAVTAPPKPAPRTVAAPPKPAPKAPPRPQPKAAKR